MVLIGRSDQGEVALIGDSKADAPVGILKDVAAVVFIELVDHDMAALHHADLVGIVLPDHSTQHLTHPGPAGVDQELSPDLTPAALCIFECADPMAAVATRRDAARPRPYVCAAVGGIAGIEDDETRIIDPAVGIFEAAAEFGFERHS